MSDSEGDISDELLELAGATEKKRRKHQAQKSSKRRRPDVTMDSDTENEPESEEDDSRSNPYPLEGKYIDEADRQRLLGMSEVEREDILTQRQEEMHRTQMKHQLDQMVRDQSGKKDDTTRSTKRQHAPRGATKEKTRKLDELKAKRRAKDEKKRTRTDSPKRERSSSPMDMETSDEEEEDGQISKFEEQEEKERRLYNQTNPDDEPITMEDLNQVRLTRDMLAKHCMAPWFEDYVKGAYVRYLIGADNHAPIYRICEVVNLGVDLVKPYKLNDQTVNQQFELKHGMSSKVWNMDKVSNSPFTVREYDRLIRVCEHEKVKLPTKRQLERKSAQLTKLANQPMTESDIAAMLARKQQMQSNRHTGASITLEKSRLNQARTLAVRRNDYEEVKQIDVQLAQLAANLAEREADRLHESSSDMLAKVNERNRKANVESVRNAELREMERKRRERKLAAVANGGAATPDSNRFKSLLNSRAGTPGTPNVKLEVGAASTPRSVSPLPPLKTSKDEKTSFEDSVLDSVEIDLGDF
ncbi:plus-3-domain-containing protein [Abortiporus biennis]|nr:plus-3-domain-containing protein [Abortiporus biennis]